MRERERDGRGVRRRRRRKREESGPAGFLGIIKPLFLEKLGDVRIILGIDRSADRGFICMFCIK